MATGSIDGVKYFGLWSADQQARVVCTMPAVESLNRRVVPHKEEIRKRYIQTRSFCFYYLERRLAKRRTT